MEGDRASLLKALISIAVGIALAIISIYLKPSKKETPVMSRHAPSPVCWPGGKSRILNELKKRIPPHRIYVEPFAGGAPLFFSKEPAEINVLNDINRDLMDFYRKLREHEGPLVCDMKPDRRRFEEIKNKPDKSVCDFLYINRNSWSCNTETFSPTRLSSKGYSDWINAGIKQVAENLDEIKRKLRKAWEVAEAVKDLKGKVLISYDNHPDVREAFEKIGWKIEEIEVPYSMEKTEKGGKKRRVKELLIRNY
ncbi:MAG: DNA adenine methylase [Deltaproteobacteria bacterium]|nr:DNA adenine methylase [Deltaproteobacteria bacterium]